METIIAKIQKLLALANNNANVNEAAAAMARAQELLLKHKMSMADVELAGGEAQEQVGQIFVDEETRLQLKWKSDLMFAVARGFFCKAVRQAKAWNTNGAQVARMIVIGKPSDTQTAHYVYQYLRNEIERLCADACEGRGFAYANAFRVGAVMEISDRMWKLSTARNQAAAAGNAEAGTALAVIDKTNAENESFIGKAYPKLKKGKSARATNYNGYLAGKTAAAGIALPGGQRQVGAGAAQIRGAR